MLVRCRISLVGGSFGMLPRAFRRRALPVRVCRRVTGRVGIVTRRHMMRAIEQTKPLARRAEHEGDQPDQSGCAMLKRSLHGARVLGRKELLVLRSYTG